MVDVVINRRPYGKSYVIAVSLQAMKWFRKNLTGDLGKDTHGMMDTELVEDFIRELKGHEFIVEAD